MRSREQLGGGLTADRSFALPYGQVVTHCGICQSLALGGRRDGQTVRSPLATAMRAIRCIAVISDSPSRAG